MEMITEHIINCDADPHVPFSHWNVEEHQKMGQLTFDQKKIELVDKLNEGEFQINGNEYSKRLKVEKVLNANVLDYLLENPEIIPEEWKHKHMLFWGTIYRDKNNNLLVRCLYYSDKDEHWRWHDHLLKNNFDFEDPAAVLVP